MKQVKNYTDQRMQTNCIHCGVILKTVATNSDHIPSKSLLRIPLPPNVPVIDICLKCNNSFSEDEEYFAVLLRCILSGSPDHTFDDHSSVRKALDNNQKLYKSIKASRINYQTIGGREVILWKPIWSRIEKVIIKNARGHGFYELGIPLRDNPAKVAAFPIQNLNQTDRDDFENCEFGESELWPEVGSRMLTRLVTGSDLTQGNWIEVQHDVYRYHVSQKENYIIVKSVLYEYLATETIWED